ncbi:MAG: 5'/3'-nucleotidase SurE [Porticoccaceae bacterium]
MPNRHLTRKFQACCLAGCLSLLISTSASALNIVLSNDDGLTSNVKALYSELKQRGHDVIVSVPCQGQSGMGAAILFLKPLTPLTESCLNNAASPGDPGAGPVTKSEENFDYQDFHYVNGTPVMATAYGLDILALQRWGQAPDLVLSGPNEGRNAGVMINSSGTVSNAQFAAARGLPAIALSAGMNSNGKFDENGNIADNPISSAVAASMGEFIQALANSANTASLLPAGIALNINFPDEIKSDTPWRAARIGTYNSSLIKFSADLSQDAAARKFGVEGQPYPGMTLEHNSAPPSAEQENDEAAVARSAVAVSVMQVSFGHNSPPQTWLQTLLDHIDH